MVTHGLESTYIKHKCKCDECKVASAKARKMRRLKGVELPYREQKSKPKRYTNDDAIADIIDILHLGE